MIIAITLYLLQQLNLPKTTTTDFVDVITVFLLLSAIMLAFLTDMGIVRFLLR